MVREQVSSNMVHTRHTASVIYAIQIFMKVLIFNQ